MRAFKRIYFHDHPMRRSKNFCEKLILMEKKPTWATLLNLTFLIAIVASTVIFLPTRELRTPTVRRLVMAVEQCSQPTQ